MVRYNRVYRDLTSLFINNISANHYESNISTFSAKHGHSNYDYCICLIVVSVLSLPALGHVLNLLWNTTF